MNKHRYLFSVDLDEFIVPKMHENIPEMLKYLQSNDVEYLARHWKQEQAMKNVQNRSSLNTTTAYNFLNAFFYQQYGKKFICFWLTNLTSSWTPTQNFFVFTLFN